MKAIMAMASKPPSTAAVAMRLVRKPLVGEGGIEGAAAEVVDDGVVAKGVTCMEEEKRLVEKGSDKELEVSNVVLAELEECDVVEFETTGYVGAVDGAGGTEKDEEGERAVLPELALDI